MRADIDRLLKPTGGRPEYLFEGNIFLWQTENPGEVGEPIVFHNEANNPKGPGIYTLHYVCSGRGKVYFSIHSGDQGNVTRPETCKDPQEIRTLQVTLTKPTRQLMVDAIPFGSPYTAVGLRVTFDKKL